MNIEELALNKHRFTINDYLVEGEVIEKEFELNYRANVMTSNGHIKMFVSNKRLFIDMGVSVRDIVYDHVSSMMYIYKGWDPLSVVTGMMSIALAIIVRLYMEYFRGDQIIDYVSSMMFLVGSMLIILGLTHKTELMEIDVVGMNKPILVGHAGYGKISGMENLFRIVRDKVNF